PANVRVTQIFLPKTMRVEWNDGGAGPGGGVSYVVQRLDAAQNVLAQVSTNNDYWVDSFDFQYGATYGYRVMTYMDNNGAELLPSPPEGANAEDITYYWLPSNWAAIEVVPMQSVAADNQTVDSRLDLRYGNPTLLDFKFGSRTYRGGLFTGYAADPSKVGRSFLRFELPALPSGASFWAGSVNAHHTVSWTDGTTEIGCQEVNDVTWDEDALKWSIAPTLVPGDATERFDVVYDSGTPANSTAWAHWNHNTELGAAITGSGLVSFGLASTSETTNRWCYFAKKEYVSALAPVALYAYEPAP
ncbi:MAG: DNRLRE domain-containing protein, partial [Actinomycetota bacterium]